mmetsp:Transcript_17000/g.43538  ORF Transcript_17000/g.43538 Transcript_17000/m.43538 type:complete len:339 (+) Transcript_17000:530-1546(+)
MAGLGALDRGSGRQPRTAGPLPGVHDARRLHTTRRRDAAGAARHGQLCLFDGRVHRRRAGGALDPARQGSRLAQHAARLGGCRRPARCGGCGLNRGHARGGPRSRARSRTRSGETAAGREGARALADGFARADLAGGRGTAGRAAPPRLVRAALLRRLRHRGMGRALGARGLPRPADRLRPHQGCHLRIGWRLLGDRGRGTLRHTRRARRVAPPLPPRRRFAGRSRLLGDDDGCAELRVGNGLAAFAIPLRRVLVRSGDRDAAGAAAQGGAGRRAGRVQHADRLRQPRAAAHRAGEPAHAARRRAARDGAGALPGLGGCVRTHLPRAGRSRAQAGRRD